MNLFGRDLLCTQDWSIEELQAVLQLSYAMKQNAYDPRWTKLLEHQSFLMFFYNPSLRTHMSFETAATQLGANAQYRIPEMGWIKRLPAEAGETLKDAVKVMARYVNAIGVRVTLDYIPYQGAGNEILQEYARWSDVPVINMADDRFHPCQGLADIMGWAEWMGEKTYNHLSSLKGKKLLLTWGKSGLARPWSSVQSHLLLASRFGMNVTLAHPPGYNLEPQVCNWAKQHCKENNTQFNIVHESEAGYEDADVVYVRNWISPQAYQNGELQKQAEIERALTYTDWTVTEEKMARTNNAIFANPMPVDRGNEVTNAVVDGDRCAIYDVAENRLHVQKAIMALVMSAEGNSLLEDIKNFEQASA